MAQNIIHLYIVTWRRSSWKYMHLWQVKLFIVIIYLHRNEEFKRDLTYLTN